MVTFLYEKECLLIQSNVRQQYDGTGYRKQKSCNQMITTLLWVVMDSNRRPSACKADALNQLS